MADGDKDKRLREVRPEDPVKDYVTWEAQAIGRALMRGCLNHSKVQLWLLCRPGLMVGDMVTELG